MSIRNRLTLQFTIIVTSIVIIFATTIFIFSKNYRQNDFNNRVRNTASNSIKLYFDVQNGNKKKKLKIADYTITTFKEKKTYLFDSLGTLVFSSPQKIAIPDNSKTIINRLKQSGDFNIATDSIQTVAFIFKQNGKNYYAISTAQDIEGEDTLNNLELILFIGLLIMIAITGVSGYFFAKRALYPIQNIVKQAESISVENISQRVKIGKEKDEIYRLAVTFNEMLNRLENAFELQKQFVANVSHELRTPLTSITGELEVNLMNTRNIDEYQETIHSILFDIKTLNQLVNNLLYLTETKLDKSNISMSSIRIDEILFLAKILELKKHSTYSIEFNLNDIPEDEDQLTIFGNEQLLTVVFLNLIDNACKYSKDTSVVVALKSHEKTIKIAFTDNGIGIPDSEIEMIFMPFQRGTNSSGIKGHGIGLSLVKNIVDIHGGSIEVESNVDKGSTFTVILQNHG